MIGDHIRVLKGGRWFHGIDCGDETVLHVAEEQPSITGSRVTRTYRLAFVMGANAVEVIAHREPVFPASMVVARAWSPIRDPALAAMFADSEAFAHWCKTGRLPGTPPVSAAAGAPSGGATAAKAMPRKPKAKAKPRSAASARRGARKPAARKAGAGRAAHRKASARKAPVRKAAARRPAARKPARATRPAKRRR